MQNLVSAATRPKHYHDIDGARSVLMFLSVVLHAGTVYAPARPWITSNAERHEFFDWVIFGLHLFITPTFFFVGGFFAVLLLAKRSVADFLWNRFLRTAVPLISIAISLNMLELYLRWTDTGGEGGPFGWFASDDFATVWATDGWQLHLWFLVSLLPMFMLAALIHGLLPRNATVRQWAVGISDRLGGWVDGSLSFAVFLIGLAAFNTANYAAASQVPNAYDLIFPGFQSFYKVMSEFPFFVIGVMAALSPPLLSALCAWRWWMPYAAAAAILFQPYAFPHHGYWQGMGMLFLNQLAMWTLVLFILQFFHRFFNKGGPRTRWLADCALSMYLFHHCLIYIYGQMLVSVNWPIGLEFVVLTIAAAASVIVIHELFVRRMTIVRLLFNGKTDIQTVRRSPGLIRSFAGARG